MIIHPWQPDKTATGIGSAAGFRRSGPPVVPINESYFPLHMAPLNEITIGSRPGKLNDLRSADPNYLLSAAWQSSWHEPLRRLALQRFAAQADLAADRHRLGAEPLIVVKEPNGSHATDMLFELLPGSRLIFLLRDGRDVVDSMLAADGPGGWRARRSESAAVASEAERLAYVRHSAWLWLLRTEATERAVAALPPTQSLTVRYENLLADTAAELGRIDSWLGLNRSVGELTKIARAQRFGSLRNRLRRNKGVRAASPGLWRDNLSSSEAAAVEALIGDKLAALDYPV